MPAPRLLPFSLDAHSAKAEPALVAADVRHFARIEDGLARQVADLEARLAERRRAPAGAGQAALERDLDIHRLTVRLRLLRRYGVDLCLGRIVREEGTLYIGRIAVTDADGEPLLVDWRAPAAEPFFAATHARPMGLTSRRRYRWTGRRITDYWDEAFTEAGLRSGAALDEQSAFIASLGASRSSRMRDVLGTLQADQDAIIRADSAGALVVDGGPGTGKTVVALHRAAYLLYADPRMQRGHGRVLFIGPSAAYAAYVADILPGLGEEGVLTCTLADLVPEGRAAAPETDRRIARLKADARMAGVVEEAVRLRERAPAEAIVIDTAWGEVRIVVADWAEAFAAADPVSTHNEAREEIWHALLDILVDRIRGDGDEARDDGRWDGEGWGDAGEDAWRDERDADDAPRLGFDDEEEFDAYGTGRVDEDAESIRQALIGDARLRAAVDRAWPLLDPSALVDRLWRSPALLRRCAPWLSSGELDLLRRAEPGGWTREDLPLLDAARLRVGDPEAAIRRRLAEAEAAAERRIMDDIVDDLIANDDSDMRVMSMLRGQDLRSTLALPAVSERPGAAATAGPFAHIVVDEAQELTDAEWQMLLRRNPSRSFTVVGDRAQARHGFASSWPDRLRRAGLRDVHVSSLTINYRTPVEIMAEAAPVIRAVLPDANVPTSIRRTGVPVRHGRATERDEILASWLADNEEGVACVIGDASFSSRPRVRALDPVAAKGLEFDLVVLVAPERFAAAEGRIEAAVDRYVAMTRATSELVVLAAG